MASKAILYSVLASFFLVSCADQSKEEYDTRAIESLDVMSDVIGALASVSYTLNDVNVTADGTEYFNEHDVYMRGPDKMYIHSNGTKGERSYWYDGTALAYYSFDKNTYATIDVPGNIINAIEYAHDKYGVNFPAADFFYPSLTDDMLADYDRVLFVGEDEIDGIKTTSILASNDVHIVQIWINAESQLPLRMSIESTGDSPEFYEATFSNFQEDPELPDIMFESEPPSNSEITELKPLK